MTESTLFLNAYLKMGNKVIDQFPLKAFSWNGVPSYPSPRFIIGVGKIEFLSSSWHLITIIISYYKTCLASPEDYWEPEYMIGNSIKQAYGLSLKELHTLCPTVESWKTLVADALKWHIINEALA